MNTGGNSGAHELTLRSFNFVDDSFDANEDGRFNQADVDHLSSLVNSMDPDQLRRFDRDGDGTVEQAEADYFEELLQSLVDAGVSSGLVGDFNNDGTVDCDDLPTGISNYASTMLGDANYRVELDSDLDGDVEDVEILSFLATLSSMSCILYADFDRSGSVNCSDMPADIDDYFFVTLASSDYRPELDANLDGTVDSAEKQRFYKTVIPGNCNTDRVVNGADLSVYTGQFGMTVTPWTGADQNGSGTVNGADGSVIMPNISNGTSCP